MPTNGFNTKSPEQFAAFQLYLASPGYQPSLWVWIWHMAYCGLNLHILNIHGLQYFLPYELLMQNTRPVAIGLSIFLFMCGNSWFLKAAYLSQLCIWWVPAVARLLVFTCTIFSIWKIFIFIISVKELPVPCSNPI